MKIDDYKKMEILIFRKDNLEKQIEDIKRFHSLLEKCQTYSGIAICSREEQRVVVEKRDIEIFNMMLSIRYRELQKVKEEIDKV